MFNYRDVVGVISGSIFLIGFLPYLIATVKGKTKPNRASWCIWSTVNAILAVSYYTLGAHSTVWLLGLTAIGYILIAACSFKYGTGGWTPFDRTCFLGALISLLLWWRFSAVAFTIWINLLIDLFGALPTIKKAWLQPEGENLLSWSLFFAATTLNLFALENWSILSLSYPVYLSSIAGIMVLLLNRSQPQLRLALKLWTQTRKRKR